MFLLHLSPSVPSSLAEYTFESLRPVSSFACERYTYLFNDWRERGVFHACGVTRVASPEADAAVARHDTSVPAAASVDPMIHSICEVDTGLA